MKKIWILFLALPLATQAQKQLVINGKVEGLQESSLVCLTDADTPTDTVAKAVVKNGKIAEWRVHMKVTFLLKD